jgi:hypothetical protein
MNNYITIFFKNFNRVWSFWIRSHVTDHQKCLRQFGVISEIVAICLERIYVTPTYISIIRSICVEITDPDRDLLTINSSTNTIIISSKWLQIV